MGRKSQSVSVDSILTDKPLENCLFVYLWREAVKLARTPEGTRIKSHECITILKGPFREPVISIKAVIGTLTV